MKLELLAPAKNAEIGIAAVNHGADAVYIGGPNFGARAAAANSIEDIAKLVRHAHLFYSRVYLALNTLFTDNTAGERELEHAVNIAHQAWNVGVDALIIQDVRLLACDLPPIALHASTQMDNRSPEKAAILEELGFQQIVLARELSLPQIADIRQATSLPLEFFIHGALCVSYSGRCFMSEMVSGRSANRGECSQCCRHHYTFHNDREFVGEKKSSGTIAEGYLLSLKDLNLSDSLEDLIKVGISSFKIEGRLKDEGYVKNITAYYRKRLDAILEERKGKEDLAPSSSGKCLFDFAPNPEKSFHRSQTDYYLHRKRNKAAEVRTPKATGERLGKVAAIRGNNFRLDCKLPDVERVSAGDGLCYFDDRGKLFGVRVNSVEGEWICLREAVPFTVSTEIRRNNDIRFCKQLTASKQPRKISIKMELIEEQDGLTLTTTDEDGVCSVIRKQCEVLPVRKFKLQEEIIEGAKKQLSRLGGTIFCLQTHNDITCTFYGSPFLPISLLNDMRRQGINAHKEQRLHNYRKRSSTKRRINPERVQELRVDPSDYPLMQTKYCIKYQLGFCSRNNSNSDKSVVAGANSLILSDKSNSYRVNFDCDNCEMSIEKLQ